MNKETIIILLALASMVWHAQVKCHIIGSIAEGTTPVEIRIYRDGEDPKNSTLHPMLKNGRFECDVVDAEIERWHIVDFGEVMENGMTLRSGEFFLEDGATVTIWLDGDKFDIQSTGKEYQAWHAMEQAAKEKFTSAYEKLDDNDKQKMEELENEYHQWTLDYYKAHPMRCERPSSVTPSPGPASLTLTMSSAYSVSTALKTVLCSSSTAMAPSLPCLTA